MTSNASLSSGPLVPNYYGGKECGEEGEYLLTPVWEDNHSATGQLLSL